MGTKIDAKRRENIREDNIRRQEKIELTRGWIFERGVGVNSTWVEGVLKPNSWIPTRVSLALTGSDSTS